jgi:hypothetical protein
MVDFLTTIVVLKMPLITPSFTVLAAICSSYANQPYTRNPVDPFMNKKVFGCLFRP